MSTLFAFATFFALLFFSDMVGSWADSRADWRRPVVALAILLVCLALTIALRVYNL